MHRWLAGVGAIVVIIAGCGTGTGHATDNACPQALSAVNAVRGAVEGVKAGTVTVDDLAAVLKAQSGRLGDSAAIASDQTLAADLQSASTSAARARVDYVNRDQETFGKDLADLAAVTNRLPAECG